MPFIEKLSWMSMCSVLVIYFIQLNTEKNRSAIVLILERL